MTISLCYDVMFLLLFLIALYRLIFLLYLLFCSAFVLLMIFISSTVKGCFIVVMVIFFYFHTQLYYYKVKSDTCNPFSFQCHRSIGMTVLSFTFNFQPHYYHAIYTIVILKCFSAIKLFISLH